MCAALAVQVQLVPLERRFSCYGLRAVRDWWIPLPHSRRVRLSMPRLGVRGVIVGAPGLSVILCRLPSEPKADCAPIR